MTETDKPIALSSNEYEQLFPEYLEYLKTARSIMPFNEWVRCKHNQKEAANG